ncbi:interleukin-15 receptor subunit alpha isoform X3 [Lemur catta]|uniref:interleukin-15 receptor subunit alpha isoform X3 n=1 Tax=Lemur catta TaxID=9447 RepID=UPI001E268877|nr:interleukin-15 receptor subunit alpha isoform X3 [Lemur catta]
MPWLLPRGCPAQALPALLLLLLLRPPATWGITCPTPTSVQHADIRVKSYSVNSRERYVCISGFKRRAGTSSLTECVLNKTTNTAHWTTPNLECISANPFSSRDVTVTISSSAVVLCVLGVALLACCLKSRQTSRPNNVEMETMEAQPMTSNREEDTETGPHHL